MNGATMVALAFARLRGGWRMRAAVGDSRPQLGRLRPPALTLDGPPRPGVWPLVALRAAWLRTATLFLILTSGCEVSNQTDVVDQTAGVDSEIVVEDGGGVCDLPDEITVANADGGSIQTVMPFVYSEDLIINERSTLTRDWITIHDARLPVDFEGTSGLITEAQLDRRTFNHDYVYRANSTLVARQPVTAFEVAFITFDVFGSMGTRLVAREVMDIQGGEAELFDWSWRSSNRDIRRHFASIAFVSRARDTNGKVYVADYETVSCVAALFSLAATVADLSSGDALIPAP